MQCNESDTRPVSLEHIASGWPLLSADVRRSSSARYVGSQLIVNSFHCLDDEAVDSSWNNGLVEYADSDSDTDEVCALLNS